MPSEKKLLTEKVKQTVLKKLQDFSELRDSDSKMTLSIWRDELLASTGKNKASELTWLDFRNALAFDKLISYESATRCRRKIQEDDPALRGTNYKERQKKEKEVRNEIRDLRTPSL